MIELRYRNIFIPMGENYGRSDKVLQIRYMTNTQEFGIQEPIWGEWQDVPTVDASQPQKER